MFYDENENLFEGIVIKALVRIIGMILALTIFMPIIGEFILNILR